MREASAEAGVEASEPSPPPPFDPDPELIGHLEGNRFALRGYRREAEALRKAVHDGFST